MIKNVLKTTPMRTEGGTKNVYVYIYNNKCKTCTKTRFDIKVHSKPSSSSQNMGFLVYISTCCINSESMTPELMSISCS